MNRAETPPERDVFSKKGHTLHIPDGTYTEMADKTKLVTAQGGEVSPGVFIQFDRLPECIYRLQAFQDTGTPEHCTAEFHVAENTASEEPLTTDLMVPWTKLADLIDTEKAAVWDVNPKTD